MDATKRSLEARRLLRASATAVAALILGACAGGPSGMDGTAAPSAAGETVWRALAQPRTSPMDGAVRIAVGTLSVPDDSGWGAGSRLPISIGFSELVATGLLRRADVHFVERRRFSAAVDAERLGQTRPEGAPPVGTSPGADLILEGSLADFGGMASALVLRLIDAESGAVKHTWRTEISGAIEPVGVARTVVGGLIARLSAEGLRPAWSDDAALAPTSFVASGVAPEAFADFLRGLNAEERWDWEGARAGYEAALAEAPDFVEAQVALARSARLRNGGSLGAS